MKSHAPLLIILQYTSAHRAHSTNYTYRSFTRIPTVATIYRLSACATKLRILIIQLSGSKMHLNFV